MENKTTIQTVKGTIFDTDRAEGVAVFIPAGLVGIRLDAERFASSFGVTDLHPKEMVVCSLPEPVSGITRHLVFFDNLKKKIETNIAKSPKICKTPKDSAQKKGPAIAGITIP